MESEEQRLLIDRPPSRVLVGNEAVVAGAEVRIEFGDFCLDFADRAHWELILDAYNRAVDSAGLKRKGT